MKYYRIIYSVNNIIKSRPLNDSNYIDFICALNDVKDSKLISFFLTGEENA